MKGREFFISGIDTDCGKTYITGLLAYHLKKSQVNVLTTKLVQTGCQGVSEDILEHRRMMENEILPEDENGSTCPFVYSFPASPHLSAQIDNKPIDFELIRKSTDQLLERYEMILTEGAGGLMVPISENYFTIDYVREHRLPLILVASSKLGSLNHTLMSIQLCLQHGINLHTLIYNKLPAHNPVIAKDSYEYIEKYLKRNSPSTKLIHGDALDKRAEMDASVFFAD